MSIIKHIFSFEWKVLWRNNTLKVLLFVVAGAGIYGIFFGKFEIDKQNARIAEVQQYERQQFDSLIAWTQLDTTVTGNKEKYQKAVSPIGVGWNKHFTYYLTNEAPVAAGLCLGQRDLFPVYYGFNVTDLARQVNVGELANPMKLLTGNFDLSYVFVFLFPLLIIALFYNLYAGEREGGTLPLVQSGTASLQKILLSKSLLRLLLIWGLASVLLLLGFLFQGISLFTHFGIFLMILSVVFGYTLFWTFIIGTIVMLRKSSATTAIIGFGVWLLITLVTPALLNLFVLASKPLPKRTNMIHTIRSLNDKVWESPKSFVFEQFLKENPDYQNTDTTDFYQWYYASFTLFDKEANALNAAFEEQVDQRNKLLEKWQWLAPGAWIHETLSRISDTDRERHQLFLEEVHAYHNELKALYYPRIFEGENFSVKDLQHLNDKL